MTQEELDKKTEKLDKLINKLGSGKNAYKAGEMLFDIRDKKEYEVKGYKGFGAYVSEALDLSEATAYKYIEIYKIFSDEDEISPLAKQSHLTFLGTQNEDVRTQMLEEMKRSDDEIIKKNPTKSINRIEPDYDVKILSGVANLLNSAKKSKTTFSKDLTEKSFYLSRDFSKFKLPTGTGKLLETGEYFEDIKKIFPFEPTCEASVIALFCCMFYKIIDLPFTIANKSFRFNTIHYFTGKESPDAEFGIVNVKNGERINFKIEFENLSTNFILHDHLNDKNATHFLICWENNFKNMHLIEFGDVLPPVLSIKELLKTGKIELEN